VKYMSSAAPGQNSADISEEIGRRSSDRNLGLAKFCRSLALAGNSLV
jgi:hypothetical protein